MENSNHYGTECEIQYIDQLARGEMSRVLTPEQMLCNYLIRARQRIENKTFGKIDGVQAIAHAEMRLAEIRGK